MEHGIDFDALRRYTRCPPAAESLLSKPEKEIRFSLNLKVEAESLIEAESYLVRNQACFDLGSLSGAL
jgi:hypothetical protein